MKTNGLIRSLVFRGILLILLSLYFLLVFAHKQDGSRNHADVLPVKVTTTLPKLLSFEGVTENKKVRLNWEFETTEGLDQCIVERADKSGKFKQVAYFFMTEDIHIPNLHYVDNVPKTRTYYYRLRLTGKDGANQCTKTLTFDVKKKDQKESLNYPLVMQ